jgi:hypothetical protein
VAEFWISRLVARRCCLRLALGFAVGGLQSSPGLEHVVARDRYRVFDRADRGLASGAGFDPSLIAGEVAVWSGGRASDHLSVVVREIRPHESADGG